jgi:hypothetical protein
VDGESGMLIDDPADPLETATAIDALLAKPELRRRIGLAGRERVRERFLGSRHLVQYIGLLESLLLPRSAAEAGSNTGSRPYSPLMPAGGAAPTVLATDEAPDEER